MCAPGKYFVLLVALIVCLISFTNGAPSEKRHTRRHLTFYDHYQTPPPWINPCGVDLFNVSRVAKALKPLREEIKRFITSLNSSNMQSIDTSDISRWFTKNSTYQFLHRINPSTFNIQLRKRHLEAQVYVGAFQFLEYKQTRDDFDRNDGKHKSKELTELFTMSKKLLCEIETAINKTGKRVPHALSYTALEKRLTFRKGLDNGVDDIDTKFTKIRFTEYLKGFQLIFRNRRGQFPKIMHMTNEPVNNRKGGKNHRKNQQQNKAPHDNYRMTLRQRRRNKNQQRRPMKLNPMIA